MFECTFKFTEEDNIVGTLYTMKRQPQKAIKALKWVLPFLLLLNIALLIWDIHDGESVLLDVTLICVMIVCMVITYSMPAIYKYSAKVAYQKTIADKDAFSVYMDENNCTVSFSKAGQEIAKEVLSWNDLTDYEEDDKRIVLIFNMKFVVVRKDVLRGDVDLLKMLLDKFAKNKQSKAN